MALWTPSGGTPVSSLLRPLGHRGVGGVDVDALLRQPPGQFRECPGLFASSNCSSVPSVNESPAPPRAFLALLTLSTTTCAEPCAPAVLFSRATIFTLAAWHKRGKL